MKDKLKLPIFSMGYLTFTLVLFLRDILHSVLPEGNFISSKSSIIGLIIAFPIYKMLEIIVLKVNNRIIKLEIQRDKLKIKQSRINKLKLVNRNNSSKQKLKTAATQNQENKTVDSPD